MSAAATPHHPGTDRAADLSHDAHGALRDLLLVLADSKRLLGMRYSDRILGAPMLEAGIAAASMAQDEWGHGRLTYALLGDFGEQPWALEHERTAGEYRSMQPLDHPPASWTETIAYALVLDTALTEQYAALLDSRYTPVHNRVQKLLDEEQFHFQYAAGWARRIGQAPEARGELAGALDRLLPEAIRWFGNEDASAVRALLQAGIVSRGPEALRERFRARLAPVLSDVLGAEPDTLRAERDWTGWDDASRRAGGEGPDAETLARVRGDRNRAMLLD